MLKHTKKILVAVAALGLITPVMEQGASAVPAFARQTNMACENCHLQHIPRLNDMGRSFRLGGMTMSTATNIEGMELPLTLNTAFFLKFRLSATTPAAGGTQAQEVGVPDEAALWAAGKMAKDWGAAIEGAGGGFVSGKIVYSTDAMGGKAGVSMFSSDALGPFWGMEIVGGTGLSVSNRGWEDRDAAGPVDAVRKGVAGITGFLNTANITVALTNWTTASSGYAGSAVNSTVFESSAMRLVYQIGEEFYVGYFSVETGAGSKGDAGVDVQWANEAKDLSVVFSNVGKGDTWDGFMNLGVTYTAAEHTNVKFSYTSKTTTAAKAGTQIGLGVNYGFAPNVEFVGEYLSRSGDAYADSSRIIAMMEIAF